MAACNEGHAHSLLTMAWFRVVPTGVDWHEKLSLHTPEAQLIWQCSMSKYNTHALLIFVVLNNYMSCDMLLKPCIHGVCKSCYKFIQREGGNLLPQPPKRKEENCFVLSKENLYNVMCTCAVCGFVLVDDAYHCDNTTHVLLEGNNHKQYLIVASIPESSPDPTLEEGKGLVTVQHFLGSCKFNILVILCVSQI